MLYLRDIIDEIWQYRDTEDILVLHGARQVGKTHIMRFLEERLRADGESTFFIDLEDSRFATILDAGVDSFLSLLREEGLLRDSEDPQKIFVFIDEIQYLKDPSPFLKLVADHHKRIKLIVSGSSSFDMKNKFSDSLVGRTVNFEIFTLSFAEFLRFKGVVFEVKNIFTQKKIEELRVLFTEYALYGGYPKVVLEPDLRKKERYVQQIIDTYVRKDIRDLAEIRDIEKFNKLLEVLACQSGNLLNVAELANICRLSAATVERYLFILENTYIIRLVRPWSKNIRSELFKVPKIYFYDTGIMQILWLKQFQHEVLGNVLETAIFAELVKKYTKEHIFYWRTKDKKEIDFILRRGNDLFPMEVKSDFSAFRASAMSYFLDKYALKEYGVVALRGDCPETFGMHPWEV